MTYYLYVKTHNITKLKYLGVTIQNPYKYSGSGLYWKRHLNQYGNSITTDILLATNDFSDLSQTAMFFSKIFNIVKSKEYANLCEECGKGTYHPSKSTKEKLRNSRLGKTLSQESKNKISIANKGNSPWNKGKRLSSLTETHKQKISKSLKGKSKSIEHIKNASLARSNPISINGKEFNCIGDAANYFDITYGAIRYRISSPKYSNYVRL